MPTYNRIGPVHTSTILECVNATEYASLPDASKDGLRIILSCGTVDLSDGSVARTALFQIFPSGVTHDALLAKFPLTTN